MKKLVSFVLAGLIVVSLSGCADRVSQTENDERDSISEDMHQQSDTLVKVKDELSNVFPDLIFSEIKSDKAKVLQMLSLLTADQITDEVVVKSTTLGEEIAFVSAQEWFDYDYVYVDIAVIGIGKISSIELDCSTGDVKTATWGSNSGAIAGNRQDNIYGDDGKIIVGDTLYSDAIISIEYNGTTQYETIADPGNIDMPKAAVVFIVTNQTDKNLTLTFKDLHVNGVDSGYVSSHSIPSNTMSLVDVRFDELPEVVENIHASGNIMFDDYSTSDFKF